MVSEQEFTDLLAEVAELRKEMKAVKARQYAWVLGGADDQFLGGHGSQYFADGSMRIDRNGIQIKTGSDVAVWFVPEFTNDPDALTDEFAYISGGATDGGGSSASIQANVSGRSASLSMQAQPGAGGMTWAVASPALRLSPQSSDPINPQNGLTWYDDTAGQFQGYRASATKNFLMEGDASSGMKTSGGGYYLIPAGPSIGTTVSSAAGADTYGSWTQMRAASGNALYIVGYRLIPSTSVNVNYVQLDIGTGGAGAETSVGESAHGGDLSGVGFAPEPVYFPYPIAVAANTRIAARTADESASAGGHRLQLIVVDQTDLVAI